MTYPIEILPSIGKSRISSTFHDKWLIRKCSSTSIIDEFSKELKDEFVCTYSKHLLNWSCNLLGVFSIQHIRLDIINNALNEFWDFQSNITTPIFNSDFIINSNNGYYFINISDLLEKLKVPYEYSDQNNLQALPYIFHCPTVCNFYHVEVRFKDHNGESIDPSNGNKWVKRITSWLKNNIRHCCSFDIPTSGMFKD